MTSAVSARGTDAPSHSHNSAPATNVSRSHVSATECFRALRSLPVFSDLSDLQIGALIAVCVVVERPQNTVFVSEGSVVDGLHVIVTGSVCFTGSAHSVELTVKDRAGDYFGAEYLADHSDDDRWPLTITTIQPTVFISCSIAAFASFARENPQANSVLSRLSYAIRVQLHQIKSFHEVDVNKRRQLGTMFELRRCAAKQVLCKQGDPSDGLYIVIQGTLDVTQTSGRIQKYLSSMTVGDIVGEIGTIQNTPRTATVTARDDCLLLFLSTNNFQTFLVLSPDLARSDTFREIISLRTANTLRLFRIFAFLDQELTAAETPERRALRLKDLGRSFQFVVYNRDEIVFHEDDQPDALYLIVKGSVEVSSSKDTLDEMEDIELGKEDIFGEIALFSHTRRTATVRCKQPCVMLKLLAKDFDDFMMTFPQVKDRLKTIMTFRIAKSLQSIPFFQRS